MIASASSSEKQIGFSTKACFPASTDAITASVFGSE